MILHLLTDEKFSDYVIEQFSEPEMRSEFVLVPSNGALHLVKRIDQCRVVWARSKAFKDLLDGLGAYTGIVLHGLFWSRWQTPVLKAVPDHVKVAWVCWGGEIYSCRESGYTFRAPFTRLFLKVRHLFKRDSDKRSFDWEVPKELYKRLDYCTTSIEEEFEYAKSFFQNDMRHVWYTYYSVEETVGPLMEEHCHGNNIWMGNSAAVCNNHLDMMFLLAKIKYRSRIKGRKLVTPLSYGEPWMRSIVDRVGLFLFKDSFKPLRRFLPRDKYNALMLDCSTLIIGATEPLAQGNIITALWLGMRVYLSEKSMSYHFFNRIGAVVFSLEKDLSKYFFSSLSDEEVRKNREVLSRVYGKEHVMQGARALVQALS